MQQTFSRLLAALAALVVSLLSVALVGAAAPAGAVAPSSACLGSRGYPVEPAATVQVSSTGPRVDEVIEVSGVRFCADERIVITYQGRQVATARTDATGSFDPPVKVTGPAGQKQICARGETDIAQNRDCITVTSRVGDDGNRNPDSGTTASTGTNLWLYVVLALVLLAAGAVAVAAGRRRRHALR